jgi:hypothetical protein
MSGFQIYGPIWHSAASSWTHGVFNSKKNWDYTVKRVRYIPLQVNDMWGSHDSITCEFNGTYLTFGSFNDWIFKKTACTSGGVSIHESVHPGKYNNRNTKI